ncbi:MAG: O-linked N-acetylglucosamine transferase, SPINDLY family protein [Sulfuricaulis sp.]
MNARADAVTAHRHGDFTQAERLYRVLLQTNPSDAELHYCMGLLCHQLGRTSESKQWLERSVTLAPSAIPAWQLLVRVCDETADASGAIAAISRYLSLRPDDAAMLNVKGQQLVRLGRMREAERAFHQAAERTGNAGMYHDLGLCRQLLGDLAGTIDAYQEAIRRGNNHGRTRLWLAQCLRAVGRIPEYSKAAVEAEHAAPDDIEILIEAQVARRYVCDWTGFETNQTRLQADLQKILASDSTEQIPPGILNILEIDDTTISRIARRYAKQLSTSAEMLRQKFPKPTARAEERQIKLGYLSTDFFAHAVGYLVRDLFSRHDRSRFAVYGYSLRHHPDEVQAVLQRGFDVYRNLSGSSAEHIARSIVEDRIDILIDLAGYTSAAQPVVLATRSAPVQISWLGYLGTSGSEFVDYLIADNIVLPPELAGNYTERIVRLPQFMPASPLTAPGFSPSHENAGFGKTGTVFCSFNQPYKLDRRTFEAWMAILRRVPESQLWMYVQDLTACGENLRREAARLNVDPGRLVFACHEPMAQHLARLPLADLALDPFHISGGATSVATLYAGVPVLTLRGESFLARMGSSINVRLGMEELDCTSSEQYVAKAVELALAPAALAALKDRLRLARQSNRFWDIDVFVRSLEEALHLIWERHVAGAVPSDICVADRPQQ